MRERKLKKKNKKTRKRQETELGTRSEGRRAKVEHMLCKSHTVGGISVLVGQCVGGRISPGQPPLFCFLRVLFLSAKCAIPHMLFQEPFCFLNLIRRGVWTE